MFFLTILAGNVLDAPDSFYCLLALEPHESANCAAWWHLRILDTECYTAA
jgi:hypothetical protein